MKSVFRHLPEAVRCGQHLFAGSVSAAPPRWYLTTATSRLKFSSRAYLARPWTSYQKKRNTGNPSRATISSEILSPKPRREYRNPREIHLMRFPLHPDERLLSRQIPHLTSPVSGFSLHELDRHRLTTTAICFCEGLEPKNVARFPHLSF